MAKTVSTKTAAKTTKPVTKTAKSASKAAPAAKTTKPAAKTAAAKAPAKSTKAAAPVKKAAAPAAKSSKSAPAKAPAKSAKAAAPAAKAPAKKVVLKKGAVTAVTIKPCKVAHTATQFVELAAEKLEMDRKAVKSVMGFCERYIIARIMNGGTGSVKMFGWNFKSVKKPAQKGGVKKPNPFKPGETMITKAKPASMRAKALALAAVKKGIAL